MGTWISHLRIAENLLVVLPGLDVAAFAFGSLAPDSGIPNADWSAFEPPKTVTHLLNPGEDEDKIEDLAFYRKHLAGFKPAADPAGYAFRLAYFFHLISDNLWSRRIGRRAKLDFASLIAERGVDAWWEMKRDWYGLDHRYLRDHPGTLFWRVVCVSSLPASHLDFLPEAALHQQMRYIQDFYRDPGDRVLDRAYPYLSEATMDRYVTDTTAALLAIHGRLEDGALPAGRSALQWLSPAECGPLPSPLGDVV